MLSHFSRVWLCVTPQTAAHQAPPSLGFSRQEHWSGLPFPSPVHESEKWKWSPSVVSDSERPLDCSLPGSPVHGIFQARVLEWGYHCLLRKFQLLTFKSSINFELIFVSGVREGSNFILLHVVIQFSQYHSFIEETYPFRIYYSWPHCGIIS